MVLLGENREELGGSEWLAVRRGREAGVPPVVDLAHERRLFALLARGVAEGWIRSAHDVSSGGLAVALAECTFSASARSPVGARVWLCDRMRPDVLLFGEATGRVIVSSGDPEVLLRAAREADVPAQTIGETGGERLVIAPEQGTPWIDASALRLREIWANALPRRVEVA